MVPFCYLRQHLGIENVSHRLLLRWQGRRWIETWKNWANFSNNVMAIQQNSPKMINVWASLWNLFYTFFYNSTSSWQTPFKNFYFPTVATFRTFPPYPVGNGSLSCMELIAGIICQLSCNKGFVPEKPDAMYYRYNVFARNWTTWPGGEFVSAFCVYNKTD